MSNDNIIRIDLEKPAYSRALDNEFFLQRDAEKKLKELLKAFAENEGTDAKYNKENKLSYNRLLSNNTIFVSGRRGAGKTTFLKTILSKIKSNTLFNKEHEDNKSILVGSYFDPTAIDTNQHILVDIITSIKDSLFKEKYSECRNENGIEKINKALFKMSKGLQLLNTKKDSDFSDPSWFLDSALNNSESGLKLVDYLNEFIDEICDQFGFELILVAIDDVDTNSNKAYQMLELVRNYFNHPKLVVIISGDLELYSHIVLKQKYEELFIKDYKNSDEESERFKNLCNNIEQQYLAKIFPMENRINLKQFDEIVKLHEIRLITKDKIEILYKEYIKNKLSKLLNTEGENLGLYIQFIEQQALRTILQLLKCFDLYNDKGSLILNTPNIIKDCFLGLLFRANIDVDGLISNNTHFNMIAYELFKILEKHQELETGFYLRPGSNNETYNATMFLFSAIVQRYLDDNNNRNKIAKSINFMLTSGASATIYASLVSDNLKSGYSYKEYLDYIGLNKRDNIVSFTSHLSPIFFPGDRTIKKMNKGGIFRIPRGITKKYRIDGELENYTLISNIIPELYKVSNEQEILITLSGLSSKLSSLKINDFKKYVAHYSLLSSSHSLLTKTEGRDYCSIYCLLASISESLLNESDEDKLSAKLISLQYFSAPNFINSEADSKENYESEYDSIGKDVENSDECHLLLNKLLIEWRTNVSNVSISPILLGKMWVRIFYTINKISETLNESGNRNKFVLGEIFSLFCYGIINACLIEEIRYINFFEKEPVVNYIDKINIIKSARRKLVKAKNVVTSRKMFFDNYKILLESIDENNKGSIGEVIKISDIVPFTYSLSMCPLIKVFLGISEDDKLYYNNFKIKFNEISKRHSWVVEQDILETFNDYLNRFLNKEKSNREFGEENKELKVEGVEEVYKAESDKEGKSGSGENSKQLNIVKIDGTINPLSEISLVPIMVTN
ncbi:hypothetical protein I4902_03115 [Proteus alimentorum]|uniref:ATP-binding protein n=1 Tax=Proteus alimentorum TaxID=1973495 RepID=A0ABS0IQH4_9GAMM|nr:P-loop NTPase fold protein [Proteus alimentorum]MBG2874869.1 hypothetical protein [Proteus alimentorum]MBG2878257.1 hypothetical protein [Proteus alimentorum]